MKHIKKIFISLLLLVSASCINAQDSTYIKYHNFEASGSYVYIKVPYYGFFKNNEFFNIDCKNVQLSYTTNFKRNPNWFWGVLGGYEWYRTYFYSDFVGNGSSQQDQTGLTMIDIINGKTTYPLNFQDSMIKYFGEPTYYYSEAIKWAYILGYEKQINNRISLKFFIESNGLVFRELGRLHNGITFDYLSVEGTGIFSLTPFYPIVYVLEKMSGKIPTGLVKYNLNLQYRVYKVHSLSFSLGWANLFFTDPVEARPSYHLLGCAHSVCSPPHFEIKVLPAIYKRVTLSVGYNIKFQKYKKWKQEPEESEE